MFTQLFLHKYDALWDRFFGLDIEPKVYNYSTYIDSPGNIYVSEVSFYNFTNGVIRIDGSGFEEHFNVLISKSFFYNSYSPGEGGSIRITKSNIKCIQYRVCSINSRSVLMGSHSYVFLDYSIDSKNYIIETSISKSAGARRFCIFLFGNDKLIDSSNISHAECDEHTAYGCYYAIMINFTSIHNNTAFRWLIFHQLGPKHNFYRCNVINNRAKQGLIHTFECRFQISFCVIASNTYFYLFDYHYNFDIDVDHCYIDIDSNYHSYNFHTTDNLVLNLRHLSTQECVADFPINIEFYPETSHIENPYKNYDRLKLIPR